MRQTRTDRRRGAQAIALAAERRERVLATALAAAALSGALLAAVRLLLGV